MFNMIIGLTGTLGAGKGTVVEFLKKKGFKHYSVREYLNKILIKEQKKLTRENLVNLANKLRTENSPSYIVEKLFEQGFKKNKNIVIESLRNLGEIEALRRKKNFKLISIDANPRIRYTRIKKRNSTTDKIPYEKFLEQELKELNSNNSNEQNLFASMQIADYKIRNNNSKKELEKTLNKILKNIKYKKPKERKEKKFSAGILSDIQIKEKRKEGKLSITPFDINCLQPASYDLHLDNQFKIFKQHEAEIIDTKKPVKEIMKDVTINSEESFILHPGSFALALIKETTGVDNKHVGRLEGKSSLARLGLIIHTTAGFLDPGNSLQLTLELFNASPLPIKLYPGMKIAQIAFEELQQECEKPYGKNHGSSYYKANKIQESQMYKNFKKFNKKTGLYNPKNSN